MQVVPAAAAADPHHSTASNESYVKVGPTKLNLLIKFNVVTFFILVYIEFGSRKSIKMYKK